MFLSGNKIKKTGAYFLLVLTTFFWGTTFVVVKDAVSQVDVFVFLSQRFIAAFAIMLLAWPVLYTHFSRYTFKRGLILGSVLFGGFSLQTLSLTHTSASNTAFLTGMSVVFVPLLSALIFKSLITNNSKFAALLSFGGLYLLCAGTSVSFNKGDLLGFLCAICLAMHIILTGRYAKKCDIFWLSAIQIATIGFLSSLTAVCTGNDILVWYPGIRNALIICVLFATVFAFVVQTTMQQYISPSSTALIFCLEPVFAAVCAYLLTGETLGTRGIAGAFLILAGMIISELPGLSLLKKKS